MIDINSVLSNFTDWKGFEKFVAKMYSDNADVVVQHNVTMIGKYGDKRQIDVLVTQKSKLHTYQTLIECKFLKEDKVDRGVIDILAASVEDLNANKGAIITTVGYEAGAIEYAKGKNIDIFIVRNVLDGEWGNTGKVLKLWLQLFSGKIEGISFGSSRFHSTSGKIPSTNKLAIEIKPEKNQILPESLDLLRLMNLKKGKNLLQMIFDIQQKFLVDLQTQTNGLLDESKGNRLVFRTKANFNFNTTSFRFLPFEHGYLELDTIEINYLLSILQTKMEFDRSEKYDLVLIVENYITNQKNFVSKEKNDDKISLSEPLKETKIDPANDLRNGGIVKIILDYYVGFNDEANIEIRDTNSVNVTIQDPIAN
jgi:hypothetical protein